MDLALDADAFHFLRKLGLLADLLALARAQPAKVVLHTTAYVARHELNSLSAEIDALEREGVLQIHRVATGTPTFRLFRELQQDYDKGESELGAWIATERPDVILVSCDAEVPRMAKKLKFRALDLGQLAVVLVMDGLLSQPHMEDRLSPWANPHVGLGRPAWWTTLAAALALGHPFVS